MKFILLFALVLYNSNAQKFDFGQDPCPNLPAMTNFDEAKFSGKWLEYKKYYALYEPFAICVTNNIGTKKNALTVTHTHTDFLPPAFTPTVTVDKKKLTYFGEKTVARFNATYKFLQFIPFPKTFDYRILETDYTNYTVSFACVDTGVARLKFAWLWTRSNKPSQETRDKMNQVLTNNKLSTKGMMYTWQFTCF